VRTIAPSGITTPCWENSDVVVPSPEKDELSYAIERCGEPKSKSTRAPGTPESLSTPRSAKLEVPDTGPACTPRRPPIDN
jgi:hypothetical protein